MKKFTHLLLIFPHPDDETFSAAGTVQLYKNTYQATITCASLTAGEMGRNFGTPPMANRETLQEYARKSLKMPAVLWVSIACIISDFAIKR
ncbi:LmbE family protein [Geomicrobium sp. JCM 19037]|uniref:PIG-L family deacetylase n=1 Tax=Geomicrobium sp. JCM 19037 TaxID=1460634 RepID=UPI00045F488A|nr:PIG-L family deacetylase [Geomicrobium sp. JCM 19037]GAK03772.1 LmbE family protein [Geomicrobium sp. JCM 19037]